MAKKAGGKKDTRCFGYSLRAGLLLGSVATVFLAALVGAYLASKSGRTAAVTVSTEAALAKLREKRAQAKKNNDRVDEALRQLGKAQQDLDTLQQGDDSGLGPAVMAGQAGLLARLLKLLQEVESIQGDDRRGERFQASLKVERELAEIEAQVDNSTASGRQQMGLITLVRSALKVDREGGSTDGEEWNDEELLKRHGLVTYATQAYWDEAYSGGRYGTSFDWYGSWEEPDLQGHSLAEFVRPLLKKESRILMMGAGNSNMTLRMHEEGFKSLVNIDVAESLVEQMKKRHAELAGVEWYTMDAGELSFQEGDFEYVIEKGLFDALFAGTGARVQNVLSEVQRILKPGGRLISVSFADDRLKRLFEEVSSTLNCNVAGELQYKKKANSTEEAPKPGQQSFFVYSCDRV